MEEVIGEGKLFSEPGKGTQAEAMPLAEPPAGVNLNFNIPVEIFKQFQNGDPKALIEMIKAVSPKPTIERPFPDWKSVKKRTNKVCILGFADSYKEAPFNDETWEIWGLNSLFEWIPRYDRWFEIHERKLFAWDTNKEIGYGLTRTGQPYMEALAQLKCKDGTPVPTYMVEAYPDIPNSIRYPIEDIITAFDPQQRHHIWKEPFKNSYELEWNGYLTNSVSYMIALAAYEGYEEIGIYGVDMAQIAGGEYSMQRASCEYYVGIAVGKGIKVTIPGSADLLKGRMIYGFEAEHQNQWKQKTTSLVRAMNERYNMAQQQFMMAQKQMDQYVGAIECTKELDRIWGECSMPSGEGPMYPLPKSTGGKLT